MSTPNPDDPQRFNDEPDGRTHARSHMGSILWILLLVALIAIGIWWYSERTGVGMPQPTTTTTEEELPPVKDRRVAPVTPEEEAAKETTGGPAPAPVTQPAPAKPTAAVPRDRDRDPKPLASNRQPEYPARALRSGVEGSVSVLIEIDAQGVPTDVRVVSRSGERSRDLDQAVVSAARAWRFDPAIRDGRAVPGEVILPVDFQRN